MTHDMQDSLNNTTRFPLRKFGDQRTIDPYIQTTKRRKLSAKILYPGKVSIRNEGERKTFPERERKWEREREIITIRLVLQEMLKGVFKA